MKPLTKQQIEALIAAADSLEDNYVGTQVYRWETDARVDSAIEALKDSGLAEGESFELTDGRVVEYTINTVVLDRKVLTVYKNNTYGEYEEYIVDSEMN